MMMEVQYFRGLRDLYNVKVHGNGIYFATDTKEILHNGLSFSGQIPPELSEVVAKAESNRVAIEILNGSGEGSVQQQINNAINEFATQISDNGTIDTFKELLEFAAINGAQIGTLVTLVNELKTENETQNLKITSLENENKDMLLKIIDNTKAIENLSQEVDTKIDSAFSWQNVA